MTNTIAQHNLMYYIVELMDFHNFKQMVCPFLGECIRLGVERSSRDDYYVLCIRLSFTGVCVCMYMYF